MLDACFVLVFSLLRWVSSFQTLGLIMFNFSVTRCTFRSFRHRASIVGQTLIFLLVALGMAAEYASAHEGPDPIAHWFFNTRSAQGNKLNARLGPDAKISGTIKVVRDDVGESLLLAADTSLELGDDLARLSNYLPRKEMTVASWFAVNQPREWGGVIGVIQDNGNREKGWVLGYGYNRFYFGLATKGADDGDGKMTYLYSDARFEKGRLYHVAAVYDGTKMQIFVNGELSGESKVQSGDILYPKSAPFVLGKYKDADEDHPHLGRIREVVLYDMAAKPEWVKKEFTHQEQLVSLPPQGVAPVKFDFMIKPYLQFVTQDGITVMCQTSKAAMAEVHYGETVAVDQKIVGEKNRFIHEGKISGLQPETQYFYKVVTTDAEGKKIESEVRTFQTANKETTPFSFAVISDTQSNPAVSGKVAQHAWAQRPNFLLHPGDLVGTGSNDDHWTKQYFPSMEPLVSRVAFFPVLGNHEVNARNYYDYMSLPSPEYYYTYSYGNSQFFMIDTNKNVGPDSEQYKWLAKELSKCKSTWKIVCHHHPPYSSDENDYGNLWKTNRSTRGDLRARQLAKLYDEFNVDIVWSGHIHSYERTWPIKADKVVQKSGSIYMITGGGGGGLETAGPFKPAFQNNVRRGHHYCMVSVNGKLLEIKAFDLENRLFDYVKIEK